ncbi:type-F conjugative transfer system protein TrbI [Pantoea ananatis]|uniref:type-F conjugative transfer system protein TrbI n=1 Tax=Pantoea ananas TaxID=553 RepID=UPI001FF0A398|nr:type-F conjugative transfer system protein TrbI [Pantoea ananatis]
MHDDTQTAGETRPAAGADNAASGGLCLRPVRLAGCAVLLLAACAGISLLVSRIAQPDTVVFDMRGTVNAFKQQSAQMTLSLPLTRASTAHHFSYSIQLFTVNSTCAVLTPQCPSEQKPEPDLKPHRPH